MVLYCEDAKGTAKVRPGSFIVQEAKIRYGWAFLQLEMLKYGTAEVFFH